MVSGRTVPSGVQAYPKVIPSRGAIPWFFVGASMASVMQECHSFEPEASS